MKVAVIGAGWAGLAAAVELSTAGAGVTVFEAGREAGGRARNVALNGRQLDNGQHIMVGAYDETLRLMRQVGADPQQLLLRTPLELSFPGRFRLRLPQWPAPLHLAAGLLTAAGAGLSEKLAAARFMSALKRCRYRLVRDCSVSELLAAHRQGPALCRYLWEPLCLAALNTPPQRASAQIFVNVLRDSLGGARAATDLLLPQAPIGDLFPRPALTWLKAQGVRYVPGTRVTALERSQSGWRVQGQDFAHIIIATAPLAASRLLIGRPAQADWLTAIADYAWEPIATVYLAYADGARLPRPMLGLDGGIGQWVFDRGVLGATPGTFAAVLSGTGDWDALDNTTLARRLDEEIRSAVPGLPALLWNKVVREQRATFSCRPDLPRPPARTPEQGLWLAGDYVYPDYPATLEAAVRSGVATARGVLAS